MRSGLGGSGGFGSARRELSPCGSYRGETVVRVRLSSASGDATRTSKRSQSGVMWLKTGWSPSCRRKTVGAMESHRSGQSSQNAAMSVSFTTTQRSTLLNWSLAPRETSHQPDALHSSVSTKHLTRAPNQVLLSVIAYLIRGGRLGSTRGHGAHRAAPGTVTKQQPARQSSSGTPTRPRTSSDVAWRVRATLAALGPGRVLCRGSTRNRQGCWFF